MRHKAAVALTFACGAVLGAHVLGAQGRGNAGTASIAGRVLDAATLTPVRRAEIAAVNPSGVRIAATTDDEGRYQLDRLTTGSWRVTISKPGYFTWQLGQKRPFRAPPPVAVTGGERLTADVQLTRGGAISGRVYDEFGEPVAGLQVRVYRARMLRGRRHAEGVGAADLTDDTGAFRVYGLPPGDYYVGASLRVAPVDSIVETTYAPTYYPGTGNLAEAQRIKLTLGGEGNAVFPLLPIRRVRVSGVVANSSGGPANAFLNLESEVTELGMPIGVGGVTRADGTFTIPDVSSGRYNLIASLRGDGPDESGEVPVTVDGDDVTGISITTGKAATLRGSFAADAGISRRLPTGPTVTAITARASGTVLSSSSGLEFELGSLSEPFHLSVDDLPNDWAVKDVLVNGVSAIDGPIDLPRGQAAEARIVLTDRLTEIAGIVDAPTPTDISVVVFPEDSAKWGFKTRYVQLARTDASGQFRITGLPPGRQYMAVATDYLEDGEHLDPEFLATMREFAVELSLGEGEKRAIGLRLVER
jgi:hypothetical protein